MTENKNIGLIREDQLHTEKRGYTKTSSTSDQLPISQRPEADTISRSSQNSSESKNSNLRDNVEVVAPEVIAVEDHYAQQPPDIVVPVTVPATETSEPLRYQDFRLTIQACASSDQPTPSYSSYAYPVDVLLASLKRISELRKRILVGRSAVKERSKYMRNSQQKLIKEVRKLLVGMRQATPRRTAAVSESGKVENLTDWEMCFAEIEDLLAKVEETGETLHKEQRETIDLEWDLCELEQDPFKDSDWVLPENNRHEQVLMRPDSRLFDGGETDGPLLASETAPARVRSAASVNHGFNDEQLLEEAGAMFYSDYGGSESADSDGIGNENDISDVNLEDTYDLQPDESNPVQQSTSVSSYDGANLSTLAGSQFIDIDLNKEMEERSSAQTSKAYKPSSFTEDHSTGFFRWLAYGTPWNTQQISSEESLRIVMSNLQMFRAWILGNLEALRAPHYQSAEDERNYSIVTKYVRNWQWDLHANAKAGPEDSTLQDHETMRGEIKSDFEDSRTEHPQSPPFSESLPLESPNDSSASAPEQPGSQEIPPDDRWKLPTFSPSEDFARELQRHNLPTHQERHHRSQSLPTKLP